MANGAIVRRNPFSMLSPSQQTVAWNSVEQPLDPRLAIGHAGPQSEA